MTRIKQFFNAIFAKITDEDKAYVKKHLNEAGEKLFYGMKVFDQAHSIAVARTIETFDYEGDRNFLIRLALLHDVGRKNINVFDKVFFVLISKASIKLTKKLSNYFTSLYVCLNHAKISAELLKSAGFDIEAEIVRYHHEGEFNPSVELMLLMRADNLN